MKQPADIRFASIYVDTTPRDRVTEDKYWRQNGACLSAAPDLFTGPDEETKHEPVAIRQLRLSLAKSICQLCTVQRQCFEHAIAEPDSDSVRAGLMPRQVEAIRHQIAVSAEQQEEQLQEFTANLVSDQTLQITPPRSC